MKEDDVRKTAFAIPLTRPSYPPGPYKFFNREYFVITYKTDRDAVERIVPEPLVFADPIVKYEFIRMPDSTGFGDYTESGQVIPVTFRGEAGAYVHSMYLNDESPIAGGREIWGFPKKLAEPSLRADVDTLVGTLDYGPVRVATGTMGYKYRTLDNETVRKAFSIPNYTIKIIPNADCTPRICELVRFRLEDLVVKGAWEGPASLELFHHALAPVAELPVREVLSAVHVLTDLTLGLGEIVHDYLNR
jgi:acetoacetate decarboxylase